MHRHSIHEEVPQFKTSDDLPNTMSRTLTNDLGIMRPSRRIEAKEDKGLSSAESSKVWQNPQQNDNTNHRQANDVGRSEIAKTCEKHAKTEEVYEE